AVQVQASGAPVLLVAADVPYPEPLHAKRPVADSFALALLLAPGGAGRELVLALTGDAAPTPCAHDGLEGVRRTIPAARTLPLLQALAGDAAADVVVEGDTGWGLALAVGAAR
ncbi:MAG: 3-oxoacyl-ACP synthase, partial [Rubrivivax sp.]|nr:3-oxoacyl-ACP synthase [Rubrivivax sp.]